MSEGVEVDFTRPTSALVSILRSILNLDSPGPDVYSNPGQPQGTTVLAAVSL